jgi:hypothetical protein
MFVQGGHVCRQVAFTRSFHMGTEHTSDVSASLICGQTIAPFNRNNRSPRFGHPNRQREVMWK